MITDTSVVRISADLADLVPRYLNNRQSDLDAARQLLRDGEFYLLAGMAHRIRGSASSYGFVGLDVIAKAIERAAQQRDSADIEHHLQALERFLQNVEVAYV